MPSIAEVPSKDRRPYSNSDHDVAMYLDYLKRLHFDARFITDFLSFRSECKNELASMGQSIDRIKPVPDFIYCPGRTRIPKSDTFVFHSGAFDTLAEIFGELDNSSNGFCVDHNGQIVIAKPKALVPKFEVFSFSIRTSDVYHLPEDHQAVELYLLGKRLIEKVKRSFGELADTNLLLLGEGFNDNLESVLKSIKNL